MPKASLYRGDLLFEISVDGHPFPPDICARLCGFDYVPPEPEKNLDRPVPAPDANTDQAPTKSIETKAPTENYPFWYASSLTVEPEAETEFRHQVPEAIRNARQQTTEDYRHGLDRIPGRPLLPWSRLWPFLKKVLGRKTPGRQPDILRVVHHLAKARPLVHLPRNLRRAWHSQVYLLVDKRLELAPFWDDYEYLYRRLRGDRGGVGLHVHSVEFDESETPDLFSHGEPLVPSWRSRLLHSGSAAVLALGDLRQYQNTFAQTPWLNLGRQLRRRGFEPWALCPCPRDRWSPAMARTWNLAYWDRGARLSRIEQGQSAEPFPERSHATLGRQRADELLKLLAPAIRVERGLLRDLRLLLSGSQADVGTEFDVFTEGGGNNHGFTLPSTRLTLLRAQLTSLPLDLLAQVIATLRRHHAYCDHIYGHLELNALHDVLPPDSCKYLIEQGVVPASGFEKAQQFSAQMAATLRRSPQGFDRAGTKRFAARDLERLQDKALEDPVLQSIWALAHEGESRELEPWVKPSNIAWLRHPTPQEIQRPIILTAYGIATPGLPLLGFPLGKLCSRWDAFTAAFRWRPGQPKETGTWELRWAETDVLPAENFQSLEQIVLTSGRETLELLPMTRPSWAARLGYDSSGLWVEAGSTSGLPLMRWMPPPRGESTEKVISYGGFAPEHKPTWATRVALDAFGWFAEFVIGDSPFILRWIPPGRFLMGSPEKEPGRYSNEGPQHEVTITRGFWMGETPVTQAQWRAVVANSEKEPGLLSRLLGKGKSQKLSASPSHFQGPDTLPVESVSWDDSQNFCQLVNARLAETLPPGFRFALPTEAQWEYACRAGTDTALYSGPISIRGEHDAPELDAIGWYGGNSGRELEVQNPHDTKGWPEKQYSDTQAGTHRVKLKPANPWGLHDMIGNVWEWCSDVWDAEAYAKRNPGTSDPENNFAKDDADRVVRGGSWISRARYCRAAYRGRFEPGVLRLSLGLRLAAGQEPERAEPKSAKRPERR